MQAACSKQIKFSNTLFSWWLFCYWRKSYISHGNLYPCHLNVVCLVLKAIGCSGMADAWSSSLYDTHDSRLTHTHARSQREKYTCHGALMICVWFIKWQNSAYSIGILHFALLQRNSVWLQSVHIYVNERLY